MQDIGKKLVQLRKSSGLSIEDLAQKTKIAQLTLQAIEDGNTHHLPPKIFLRGFLSTYIRTVGGDHDELMAEFDQKHSNLFPRANTPPASSRLNPSDLESRRNFLWFNTSSKIILIFSALFIGLLIYLIIFLTGKMNSYQMEKEISDKNSKIISPIEAPVLISSDKVSTEVPEEEVKNKIRHRLQLVASSSVSIKLMIQGEDPQLIYLYKGKERIIESKKPLVLDISTGGALKIVHNNKDYGLVGEKGRSLRLVYP